MHAYLAAQRLVDRGHHAVHDVVDVCVVSGGVAVPVLLDRDAVVHALDELERRHVGPTAGAVHGEKPQPGAVQTVQVVKGIGEKLAVGWKQYRGGGMWWYQWGTAERENGGTSTYHAFFVAA